MSVARGTTANMSKDIVSPTGQSVEDLLASPSPSDRLRCAAWIKVNPDRVSTQTLMRAMQRETVPQIRQLFNDALIQREAVRANSNTKAPDGVPPNYSPVPELARLIRHELSPAIGWIKRAANREIVNFQRSATIDALNRLERRIDSLVSLIRADSVLEFDDCNLETLLRQCWPDFAADVLFTPADDLLGKPARIRTDVGLFEVLLANAYQNAIDASSESSDQREISVTWSVVGDRFWVRITNSFNGTQFDIQDVETTGISTKSGHQGIGIALIKTAADRLGYGFRVAGRSGIATFTLTGARE